MSDFREMVIEMTRMQADAIYEQERERRAGLLDSCGIEEDRYDSDEDELKAESKRLRDYDFLREE
jgi:hypothetical protein